MVGTGGRLSVFQDFVALPTDPHAISILSVGFFTGSFLVAVPFCYFLLRLKLFLQGDDSCFLGLPLQPPCPPSAVPPQLTGEMRINGSGYSLAQLKKWGGYVMQVVAIELAREFRVITWDRSNTDGGSSIVLEGTQSEADLWADQLAGLIRALGLGPCYVGEYAGCRTTPLLCHKNRELVRGLMLAWPSGGEVPAERLPRNMYRQYTRPALRDGMDAVAKASGLTFYDRLFAMWHLLHMPLYFLLILTGIIHVIAVHLY